MTSAENAPLARRFLVRGRVQGVGFRWFVVEKAQQLKLSGWVRNKRDGHVEIAAAGDRQSLASLEAAVKRATAGTRCSSASC